jgi:hypothetical protein
MAKKTTKVAKKSRPTSPFDENAWYPIPKRGSRACSPGTHKAPGYRKIRSPKRYCVRDCKDWLPPRRDTGTKGGRTCVMKKKGARPKTVWMIFLQAVKKELQRKQGKSPTDLKDSMILAKKFYGKVKSATGNDPKRLTDRLLKEHLGKMKF